MEQAPLICPKCGRTLTLNLQALARRRACAYCGAALTLPAELESKLAALVESRPAAPLAVGCPVCGRATKVPGSLSGKPSHCGYCGARFLVPAAAGPGLDLRVVEAAPQPPLEEALSKPEAKSALAGLAWEALAARWSSGCVSREEAAAVLGGLDALSRWQPTGAEVSPLPPHATTGIAQYLVLKVPNAHAILEPDASAILQIPLAGGMDISPAGGGRPLGELLVLNAVGLGLLAATGTGFIAYSKPGTKDGEDRVQVTPALWLRFLPGPLGTILGCEYQDQYGDRSPLDAEKVEKIASAIRDGFTVPARAYLVFRAMYGDWATPAIYSAASREKVQSRIAGFSGREADAAGLAAALLAPAKSAVPKGPPAI